MGSELAPGLGHEASRPPWSRPAPVKPAGASGVGVLTPLSPQMFAMKSSLEHMDAMELDFRMRLAEVQRRYKEKQRELGKLQRRRESE